MLIPEKIYVTPDDYKNIYGEDLRNLLRSDDNDSNHAERFIALVTSHLKSWIDSHTFRRLPYECLSPYQLGQFQRAILSQVYYTYHEGAKALGLTSGVDDERGTIISQETLGSVEICQAAIDYLSNAGLFNLVMKNRPRVMSGYPELNIDAGGCPEPCPTPQPTPTPQPCGNVIGVGYTEED